MRIAIACTLSAAAFLISALPAASQNGTAGTAADAPHVSVIGCVQRSPSTTTDNTTTIVPDGETRYVLSNVTLSHDATGGGNSGSNAGDLLAEAVNLYRLDDAADPMIAPHVGSRVQVSGTIQPRPAGTSGGARTPATGTGPLLKVEHIEKVSEGAASCLP